MKLFLVVAHDQIEVHGRHTIAKDADGEREEREISLRRRNNAVKIIHAIPRCFVTNYDRMSTMCVHVKIVRD